MSRLVPRNVAFRVALVWAALVLQEGCQQKEPITSWNSARMLEVKKEWQTLYDSFPVRSWSKLNFGERTTMLHGVLKRRLSHQVMKTVPSMTRLVRPPMIRQAVHRMGMSWLAAALGAVRWKPRVLRIGGMSSLGMDRAALDFVSPEAIRGIGRRDYGLWPPETLPPRFQGIPLR